ncbi:MAG: histidine phosphatase family protein [Clostridia bacterium]|nr:histidine phosphatase family protein [Clostridia bacterium]
MKLYLIRHGESEANATRSFAGWAPVPLTEKGEEDARLAGELIRSLSFDKVFSSDILRTVQTCRLAMPDAEAEQTPLIREYDVGNLVGRSIEEFMKDPAIAANRKVNNFVPYGGEDYEAVMARVTEFMQRLEQSDYENVLAFSHAGAIKNMIDHTVGVRLPFGAVAVENGAVTVLEFKNGRWMLAALNQKKEL